MSSISLVFPFAAGELLHVFKDELAGTEHSKERVSSGLRESQNQSNNATKYEAATCDDDLGCGLFSMSTALFSRPGTNGC